jgi:predicted Zn-dependent protease
MRTGHSSKGRNVRLDNEDEVAALLAHELSHVILGLSV